MTNFGRDVEGYEIVAAISKMSIWQRYWRIWTCCCHLKDANKKWWPENAHEYALCRNARCLANSLGKHQLETSCKGTVNQSMLLLCFCFMTWCMLMGNWPWEWRLVHMWTRNWPWESRRLHVDGQLAMTSMRVTWACPTKCRHTLDFILNDCCANTRISCWMLHVAVKGTNKKSWPDYAHQDELYHDSKSLMNSEH